MKRIAPFFDRLRRGAIVIRRPFEECDSRGSRVSAEVGGRKVWFASDTVALRAEPFAWLAAFVPSALRRDRELRI